MPRVIRGTNFVIIDRSFEFQREARTTMEKIIAANTIKVQKEAKRLLGEKAFPPPSEPGEAPAVRTGTLRRSIIHETIERKGEFLGRVGTNLNYGFWLELGTKRMAARPFLRPALQKGTLSLIADIERTKDIP